MPTSEASGTQTATIGTEHTLSGAALTNNKVYVLVVDCAAMADGDEVELRVYTIALSAGTEGLAYIAVYRNLDGGFDPLKYSPPVPADISFKATLKQTTGTGRSFPWKILSL